MSTGGSIAQDDQISKVRYLLVSWVNEYGVNLTSYTVPIHAILTK